MYFNYNYSKVITCIFLNILISILTPAYADDNARDVANKLNQLYQRTSSCDDNNPAFYCSGIIIHGKEIQETSDWYLSPDRAVGSFSYLRIDITPHVGHPIFTSIGYILTQPDEIYENKQYRYSVYCEYASDGRTDGGVDTSCGFGTTDSSGTSNADVDTCTSKGITTLDAYMKAYVGKIELDEDQRIGFKKQYGEEIFKKIEDSISINGQCSFSPDKNSFDVAMQIHEYVYRDNPDTLGCNFYNITDGNMESCFDNNELIIGAWKQSEVDVNQVPIKAFYVLINDKYEDDGAAADILRIESAFKTSEEYSKATNYTRRIPVITLDMTKLRNGSGDIFAPANQPKDKMSNHL